MNHQDECQATRHIHEYHLVANISPQWLGFVVGVGVLGFLAGLMF
ncbi:hypothetical protein V5E97_06835 [Singulisphaera sp. Ch08]|uniref:Uncharacterized protein n=1 Tax=Singulisphaera sp. Ch08 TaxID=3120278 RepID=A0AAU7CK00_9BACT